MPYQVSMMGWVGSGEDFCGFGWVGSRNFGLGFEKVTHDQLCFNNNNNNKLSFRNAQLTEDCQKGARGN